MVKNRKIKKAMRLSLTVCVLFMLVACPALCAGDHIKDLDAVRTSMTDLGYTMPDAIKKSSPQDIRTLERVFEINNYALVTIESYLKMIKVAVSSSGTLNKEIIAIMNGWLKFISSYCEYDIKYFDDALIDAKDEATISIINAQKNNISKLRDVSAEGIKENTKLLSGI